MDSKFNSDEYDAEPGQVCVCPNFPPTDIIQTGAGRRKDCSKPAKKKRKIAFRTRLEKEPPHLAKRPDMLAETKIFKSDFSNFDNSLLINNTNTKLEKFRNLLIKIETTIMESCKSLKTNAEIKLLEMIALKHFKKYPYMYVMCNEINNLSPFYSFFDDVYVNNFCIKIEELEKLLQSTHSRSDHLLKFKEHYSFFCERSLPLHKFGNVIKNDRGSCFFHLMALYTVHVQLKLAQDPAYDNIIV